MRLMLLVVTWLCSASAIAALDGQQPLYSFISPTDALRVESAGANFAQSQAEEAAGGEILRRVVFAPEKQPSLHLQPASGHWDWTKATSLTLRVQNAMDWALTLNVRIESTDGKVLVTRIALPAGPAQTLVVPLHADSPRAHGMRAAPPMPWKYSGHSVLLATQVEGELDSSQINKVTLFMDQPDSPQSIMLGRAGLMTDDKVEQAAYTAIVDEFGQYTRADWPGKIKKADELQAAAAKEQEQLKQWLGEPHTVDQFGGLLNGPELTSSGYFHTEKKAGRWYLVTPEGHAFFSLGVNTVTPDQSQTYIENREQMFAKLPEQGEPLNRYYGTADSRSDTGANKGRAFAQGRWFDFYQANLERTYATADCQKAKPAEQAAQPPATTPACPQGLDDKRWATHTLDRLKGWGFNTVGNWSHPALGASQKMAYTVPLSISGDYQTISTGDDWWGGMPDPFDPRFAMATERAVAIAARDHRNDPWVLGYFADNELAWAHSVAGPKGRYALAYNTLRATTDVPAKRAFLKQLRDKYRNQQGLSKAWGIELPAWELMGDPGFEAPLPSEQYPAIEADLQNFQKLFAETYFKTIADSLKWHAPNHMLLGGRFAISTPEAVAACAKYCDVLSFNIYAPEPQQGYDFKALAALDKPVMITEFHFGSNDRGPFWAGVNSVYKEQERAPAYAHFMQRAFAEPVIVGAHWFQYLDQPVTGRLLDGENGHLGLVAITDRPFAGFVDAVRKTNWQLYKQLETPDAQSADDQ
ncbi:MAG: beta-agarase [Pseudomonadaceae bacterium]|nr:beta-agarase [Pseudomonadaceae bacterium]